MTRTFLIAVHALGGTVAFAAGAEILRRRFVIHPLLSVVYAIGLVVMTVFLAAAVVVDWPDLDTNVRLTFLGLVVLAAFMLLRMTRAVTQLRKPRSIDPGSSTITDDIGFTLIALFEGLVIVTAIDLAAPPWLVAGIAITGVVMGRRSLHYLKRSG